MKWLYNFLDTFRGGNRHRQCVKVSEKGVDDALTSQARSGMYYVLCYGQYNLQINKCILLMSISQRKVHPERCVYLL